MIDNNIIQSIGAGSGIDTNSLVKQLVEIERAVPQQRIDTKKELTEAQISDFGLIKSSLGTLKDSLASLVDKEGLFSKSASFTESDALIPSELGTDVLPGTYNFQVTNVAQSQSLSSGAFSSVLDPVGQGTLTFRFGDWDAGVTAFTEDLDTLPQEIVIDSSNNTLRGMRDAINAADFGAQASIVSDGVGFRLLITAASGENKQLSIDVAEAGGAATNTDGNDLSRFAFNDSLLPDSKRLTQNQAGEDAAITINGLAVTRSSNTIDDVVDGLTVELLQESAGQTITVTVSDDKVFAEENVRGFVDAYNAFLEEVEVAFGRDEETGERGSLANDSLAKSVLGQMRNIIASEIPGLSGANFSALTNVGIRTELDGTLSINEKDFKNAFANNFEDVQALFAPTATSTAADITVNSFGGQTKSGNYDVVVTTNPVKGSYAGQAMDVGVVFPFDTTGKTYTMDLSVNGTASSTITIPTDMVYSSGDELASVMQSLINADPALKAGNASVVVSFDTDHFDILSNQYGTASVVSITAASADIATDLGLTVANGSSGIDVAGTIDGVVAFGRGNVLLPALGEDAEGLTLLVGENATTSTVNYSRGFGGELDSLIKELLSSTGLLKNREDILTDNLSTFKSDQETLDRRMNAFQERLIRQFIAMENILSGLGSTGSFLESLIDTLPFTAKK